jgi:site-specific DNA-methyltransferase (adenine-specific)
MQGKLKMELYRDHFQNYKRYNIPKAQLIIADIPFNIGMNAYASNPKWYIEGDNKKGESKLAKKEFFDTDKDFRIAEFMHFVNTMLKKEPKKINEAGCMIVFCEFEQQFMLIQKGKQYGFPNYINLVFHKNYSAQVLKANMRVVGNSTYAILLYRDKLPKFRNNGKMIFNNIEDSRDTKTPKIHPTQKSIGTIRKLIEIFTDPGDVVIDPVAGSGVTLLAAAQLGRNAYGFEIKKEYVDGFYNKLAKNIQKTIFQEAVPKKTQEVLFQNVK